MASPSSSSCLMLNLSPSWDAETIALLINKRLHHQQSNGAGVNGNDGSSLLQHHMVPPSAGSVCVTPLPHDKSSCRLDFASRMEHNQVIRCYSGIAVPMTHGYHYYTFADCCGVGNKALLPPMDIHDDSEHDDLQNDDTPFPPLHLQLMALPMNEVVRRLNLFRNVESTTTSKRRRGCRVRRHAKMVSNLLSIHLPHGTRPIVHCRGAPLPEGSTNALLQRLRTLSSWPPRRKQRRGVHAGQYLTVRKRRPPPGAKSHVPEHDELWELCKNVIDSVVPNAKYTALAITCSFRGSPHVDNHDTTYQHVIALGNFEGGQLCAEADTDGTQELRVDVRNRVGRIDGRGVHWVSEWTGSERFSIVYYSTDKEHYTERVPQSEHTAWMESMQ